MGLFDFLFGKKKDDSTSSTEFANKPKNNNIPINNIIGKYYSLEQLRPISMGQVFLKPIDAELVFEEEQKEMLCALANASPKVAKYLPNLDLSTTDAIAKYFLGYCSKTELGYEFGYSICLSNGAPIGFIFIHTPACNEKAINFPNWTIDFCLFSVFEKKGIMSQVLPRVLYLLKSEFNVHEVYAYVDESNNDCLNILSSLPFDLCSQTLTDPTTGNKAKLFCCPLHSINFRRG